MNKTASVVVLVLCLLLAGCSGVIGNEQTATEPPDKYSLHGSVSLFKSDIQVSDTGFRYDGPVRLEVIDGNLTVEGVWVCMYDSDRTLLGTERVGTLSDEESIQNVSIRLDERPKFIIVDHPEFRRYPQFSYEALVYVSSLGGYSDTRSDNYELEYSPDEMKGGCAERV